MDWSKAKNVLIIAFIVTNLFLLYNIENNVFNSKNFETVSTKYIQDVKEHLEENGIRLSTKIPKEIIALPVLMVRYKYLEPEEIVEKYLGSEYHQTDENTYVSEKGTITIKNNKKLIYKSLTDKNLSYSIDEKEAVKLSNDFLLKHGLLRDDIQLRQIYLGTIKEFDDIPVYKLIYNQTYNERFLGESYIYVYINHRGVVGAEMMLLEFEKTFGQEKEIIPATEALLRKMSNIINDNKTEEEILITGIEAGYYFNPEASMQTSSWETVESGTAFPAWKITLSNGKTYYVEAIKN